tara:strand:- start:158 stop:334 length:177 start_codon:yes stop_codon:yes gene_type:complete
MEALNKLKEYATATDNWYITNQIWYIENEISIAISKAKIEVYESIQKNNELTTKNKII